MVKSPKKYSKEEKLSLLREYHQSGMSKRSFSKVHGFCNASLLINWIKAFEKPKEVVSLPSEGEDSELSNRTKEGYRQENAELKKRIRDLEKALEISHLETKARDMLISRAEDYFNIQIRKKSGAR
ncbi:MAG: transposase [Prevotella sp.]|jgi:transposase-like protein